jgi:hypothetical protein
MASRERLARRWGVLHDDDLTAIREYFCARRDAEFTAAIEYHGRQMAMALHGRLLW